MEKMRSVISFFILCVGVIDSMSGLNDFGALKQQWMETPVVPRAWPALTEPTADINTGIERKGPPIADNRCFEQDAAELNDPTAKALLFFCYSHLWKYSVYSLHCSDA